jgi:threonine dehydrogenase-like Zn-dependent dehydrogenase
MTETASRSAVHVGSKTTEIREIPLPEIPPDGGILRVLAAGICGSDIGKYKDGQAQPRILGHENVGVVEKIGETAQQRWGLNVGDIVALEEYLPCGHCTFCLDGEYRSCIETDARLPGVMRYGTTPTTLWPALWGGYSQYQYLHPRSKFHHVPEGVDPRIAAMALPIGNGFQWVYLDGKAGPGQTVVVQGPGQQGLACVVAAKVAGASQIIATGLKKDAHRLAVAKQLGAHHTVMVDEESMVDAIRKVAPDGVDLVVDCSVGEANAVIGGGLQLLKKRGTVLMADYKKTPVQGFDLEIITRMQATLRGVRGHSYQAVELALDLMRRKTVPLEAMSTHHFGLDKVDYALRLVGGEVQDGQIHVTVTPWN